MVPIVIKFSSMQLFEPYRCWRLYSAVFNFSLPRCWSLLPQMAYFHYVNYISVFMFIWITLDTVFKLITNVYLFFWSSLVHPYAFWLLLTLFHLKHQYSVLSHLTKHFDMEFPLLYFQPCEPFKLENVVERLMKTHL